MEPSEFAGMKALEDKNARPKSLLAGTILDNLLVKYLLGNI
jgi:hypothetical protein